MIRLVVLAILVALIVLVVSIVLPTHVSPSCPCP